MQDPQASIAASAASAAGDATVRKDYLLLQRGAGVCPIASRRIIRVVGDDRVPFLHGMCSNDIRAARPGSIVPALFLTEHAHVIADFFAWIGEDSILLDIDEAGWALAHPHLEKLLVADDVEFEEQPDMAVIDIEGARACDAVRAVVAQAAALDEWRWVQAGSFAAGRLPRFGANGFSLLAPRAGAESAVESIRALGDDFRLINPAALEIVRVEHGLARVGVDTTAKTIALEARLERAISFDKGCYVGQETVERVSARGGLKKKLLGLRFAGDRVPQTGAPAHLDGTEVGVVTSAVLSPRFGAIGLAILHHSAWETGVRLAIAGNGEQIEARVCDIPFRSSLK